MADNKNQHYVPRVHLRPFTLNGEGAAINLLNIDRLKAVKNAPVKNQCSGDYFYGKDEKLEHAINFVENAYGEIVRFLSSEQAAVNDDVRSVISRFIYLQYLRTEAASRRAAEMNASILDLPGSDIPIPNMRDAMKLAVQHAMLVFAETMEAVDDLRVCIIRNKTSDYFITSDDPAILTNRLHIQRQHLRGRSFGVNTAGAIFLMPLSPKLYAVAYDSAVYQVLHRAGWIEVATVADVAALNQHQMLNCMANIYFKDWDSCDALISQIQACRELRPECRHETVHAALDYADEWGSRFVVRDLKDIGEGTDVLVHVIANHPKPSSWPSFLKFRLDAKAYSNNTRAGLTRKWCLEQRYVGGVGYQKVRV